MSDNVRRQYGWQDTELTEANHVLIPEIMKLLPYESVRILDMGCGNGTLATALQARGHEVARVLKPSGYYVGIEPSLRNPLHILRHIFGRHSANEFLVAGRFFRKAFATSGMDAQIKYIAPRHPWVSRLGLAPCLGIKAGKKHQAQ